MTEGMAPALGARGSGAFARDYLFFLPPFFLPPFAVFFAISSSLERGSSARLPVTRGYNRWAERSTLIQDVDYG